VGKARFAKAPGGIDSSPQRLKPQSFSRLYGTTEFVPFPKLE
jgi:hypothetical protein